MEGGGGGRRGAAVKGGAYPCSLAMRCSSMSSLPLKPFAKGLFSIFNCVICRQHFPHVTQRADATQGAMETGHMIYIQAVRQSVCTDVEVETVKHTHKIPTQTWYSAGSVAKQSFWVHNVSSWLLFDYFLFGLKGGDGDTTVRLDDPRHSPRSGTVFAAADAE